MFGVFVEDRYLSNIEEGEWPKNGLSLVKHVTYPWPTKEDALHAAHSYTLNQHGPEIWRVVEHNATRSSEEYLMTGRPHEFLVMDEGYGTYQP